MDGDENFVTICFVQIERLVFFALINENVCLAFLQIINIKNLKLEIFIIFVFNIELINLFKHDSILIKLQNLMSLIRPISSKTVIHYE